MLQFRRTLCLWKFECAPLTHKCCGKAHMHFVQFSILRRYGMEPTPRDKQRLSPYSRPSLRRLKPWRIQCEFDRPLCACCCASGEDRIQLPVVEGPTMRCACSNCGVSETRRCLSIQLPVEGPTMPCACENCCLSETRHGLRIVSVVAFMCSHCRTGHGQPVVKVTPAGIAKRQDDVHSRA